MGVEETPLLHDIVLHEHTHDRWKWLLDPIQGYSVHGTYHFLTASEEFLDRDRIYKVWHQHVPLKISDFAWRLLRDRIPMKTNLE